MKYPFIVKHNGITYAAGKEVPIGQEPVKENKNNDKSVNEIKAELKKLGVTKFPSNKKADLIALLEKTEAAELEKENEAEEIKESEAELEDDAELNEEVISDEEAENENEEEESNLLDKIINE